MPLTGVYGLRGSGKNIITAYLLSKFPHIHKYVNFSLDMPNCTQTESVAELFELEHCTDEAIIVNDEAYTEMDNRLSMTDINILNSYLLFQSRKRNMSIINISQLNILDLRWKGLEEYLICAQPRPIKGKDGKDYKGDFTYWFSNKIIKKPMTLRYKDASKLFDKYDTNELIMPPELENMKQKVLLNSPAKMNEYIDKCVELLKKEAVPLNYTKDWIRDNLLRLGLNTQVWSYVYTRLRNTTQ